MLQEFYAWPGKWICPLLHIHHSRRAKRRGKRREIETRDVGSGQEGRDKDAREGKRKIREAEAGENKEGGGK